MTTPSWVIDGRREPDFVRVLLYLDYGDDLSRVGPVLKMWHAQADRLLSGLLQPPGTRAKPKIQRSGFEKKPDGAGRKIRPRTWSDGITEDFYQLTWAWRATSPRADVADLSLYAFRFAERRHVMLSAAVDLDDRPGRLPVVLPPLLELLRSVADVADPVYGEVVVNAESIAPNTMLDSALLRQCDRSAAESRTYLRGYEWVTVCPKELLPRLGGVDGLRASKAFVAVDPLEHGGAILRATDDPAAYGPDQARAVFSVLATVLPPGQPRFLGGRDMSRVVLADAGAQDRAAGVLAVGPGLPALDDPQVVAAQAFVVEAFAKGWVTQESADDVIPEYLREKFAGHVKVGLTEEGRRRLDQIVDELNGT
jgi:hypothetical protein